MAYTDDVVKAKLSALNDTQESIVTVAQWVMFHRRYAERTANLWHQRLQESGTSKRLVLIYLANEVIQQSKSRKKDDFLLAFSPIIADATAVAYKDASNDVQQKIRRVVEVWKQRTVFDAAVQDSIESRIDGLDKDRPSSKRPLLGGRLFSPSSLVPPELEPLVGPQTTLTRVALAIKPAVSAAENDYAALTDPATTLPAPPVLAARLSALLKSLASAETAVVESLRARATLAEALEALLAKNRAEHEVETAQQALLNERRAEIESRKRSVEDDIMRGLSAEEADAAGAVMADNDTNTAVGGAALNSTSGSHDSYGNGDGEIERPDFEPLTPPLAPKMESFTPPYPPTASRLEAVEPMSLAPVEEASVTAPRDRTLSNSDGAPNGAKRRKTSRQGTGGDDDFVGFGTGEDAMEGLDADVVGMLG